MLEKSSLPALDGSFIVNVRALGCRRGDGIKLAHVNDDGAWETGKLYKLQAKRIPGRARGRRGQDALASCTSSGARACATGSTACARTSTARRRSGSCSRCRLRCARAPRDAGAAKRTKEQKKKKAKKAKK